MIVMAERPFLNGREIRILDAPDEGNGYDCTAVWADSPGVERFYPLVRDIEWVEVIDLTAIPRSGLPYL